MIPLVNVESCASVDRFEAAIAALHGAPGAVATNSGSSALHLALLALGVGPGWTVVFPSYSCLALLNAVRLTGAKEQLIDNWFEPESMQFNSWCDRPHAKGPKSVMIEPFMFGVVPKRNGGCPQVGAVIEDRAMALGSAVPIVGDCAVHSFHASKIISTGEGGMVVARTPELLAKLRDLNGYSDAVVADRLNDEPEYVQRVNYRISNETCRFGNDVLAAELSWSLKRRAKIAKHYLDTLGLNITLPDGSVWGRFCFSLEGRMTPPDFVRAMMSRGIEAGRGVYPALHQMLHLSGWENSNAQKATENIVSLPLYPQLTDSEVEQIIYATKEVLGR